jgi:sugar phosphate isomerase/epimerase
MAKPVALQLYSVRDYCKDDFCGTLKKVAEIGYKGVEFAGLYGHSAEEVAGWVKDLGLEVASSHVAFPTKENVNQLVDELKTLGSKYLITGFGPDDFKTVDQCKRVAERFEEAAALLKGTGITLGAHNHWWEFLPVDGQIPHDILMEGAPSIVAELDVYWTAYAKADPAKVVAAKKSRIPLLHIKDGTLEEGKPHTAVGAGVLDMPAIIGAADPNVLEWLIVELDSCETDMMEAVEQSYRYLTSSGLGFGNK